MSVEWAAVVASVVTAAMTVGGHVAVQWWRARRRSAESAEKQQARVLVAGIEGAGRDREQAVDLLQRLLKEYKAQAAQCEAEQKALRQAFDEERRTVDQLKAQVDRLERELAREREHREQLQRQLVEEYARKPSTPAPPPDDSSEDDTPVIGRGRRNRNGGA